MFDLSLCQGMEEMLHSALSSGPIELQDQIKYIMVQFQSGVSDSVYSYTTHTLRFCIMWTVYLIDLSDNSEDSGDEGGADGEVEEEEEVGVAL